MFGRTDTIPLDGSSHLARARRAWAAADAVTCAGVTRSGQPCQIRLTGGRTYCGHHKRQAPRGDAATNRAPTIEPILLLHEARHTFASLMIAAGVNAKALSVFMGHSSIQVTYDLYGHLMPGGEEEAAALLDGYLERAKSQARLAQLGASRGPVVGQSAPVRSGLERTTAEKDPGAATARIGSTMRKTA